MVVNLVSAPGLHTASRSVLLQFSPWLCSSSLICAKGQGRAGHASPREVTSSSATHAMRTHTHPRARTRTHTHTHTHLLLAAPFARQLASFTRLRVSQHRGVPQSMEAQVRQRTSPARDEPSQTTTDECLSDWPEPFSTPKRIEGTHRAVAVGFQRADTRPRRWPWRRR
jgi:hypothetical protein